MKRWSVDGLVQDDPDEQIKAEDEFTVEAPTLEVAAQMSTLRLVQAWERKCLQARCLDALKRSVWIEMIVSPFKEGP